MFALGCVDGESLDAQQSSHRELMASLESRKNSIELKLQDCTQELKELCIKEAELTGVLPPEIPLEPGESPPQFRKRVGTAFQYPENLINGCKISKSKEEETIDTLELALKIQTGIVEVALGLANDPNASKAVRRKRRQDYQLAYERLQELKAQLANCRQAHKTLKQRKKPRPPLDCEIGTSTLPIQKAENETDPRCPNYWHQTHDDTVDGVALFRHSAAQNVFLRHPQDAKAVYTLQHHRHGYYQSHFVPGQYGGHHYPTLASCAHPELERMGYWTHHDHSPVSVNRIHDVPDQEKSWYSSTHHPVRGVSSECIESQHDREWFGSLDRRKVVGSTQSDADYSSDPRCTDRNNGYCLVPPHGHFTHKVSLPQTLLPNQMYPEAASIDSHGLVRAHSLDSVGQQHSGVDHCSSNRKPKEKEWYETSLDSTPRRTKLISQRHGSPISQRHGSPISQQHGSPISQRHGSPISQRHGSPSVIRTGGTTVKMMSEDIDVISRDPSALKKCEVSAEVCNNDVSHNGEISVPISVRGLLSSPVSATLDGARSEGSDTYVTTMTANTATTPTMLTVGSFDTIVPFESPKNHTVVQAGMWQPYREVTKPFEMSDFYKYSTKFRKAASNTCQQPQASPQQKGIYQPLQPMTCKPLDPAASDELRVQDASPNTSVKDTVTPESVGDTFSNEMLAWYQDQNVPRSATLV
ncbi:uncharacterized protein LOC124554806 isoform X1 [Schistocerca americana]|uniref:uncharacterized protein LOC124554806 isoform X1 n=1 Tax=Schistocerca americana TaxID=7009 RepID=UPI001F5019B2|nr:uncharacterized protein LOC124554806 isoform X1 [Schistocerca americana]